MLVASLAVLEEYVAVFGHTACYGRLGIERTAAEVGESLTVDEGSEVVLLHDFDFLDFMRGAEAVEEVYEGDTALDGGEMCHACEIHDLLYGAFGKHCEAGLAH